MELQKEAFDLLCDFVKRERNVIEEWRSFAADGESNLIGNQNFILLCEMLSALNEIAVTPEALIMLLFSYGFFDQINWNS